MNKFKKLYKDQGFTNLHVHSDGSLLDGMITVDELLDFCKENKLTSACITDHGTMHNCYSLYQKCIEKNIKPIIGCEIYMPVYAPAEEKREDNRKNYHLTLLAKNYTGYKNLVELVSLAHTKYFYYKPRIDLEKVSKYSEGLIAMSACLSGEIPTILRAETFESSITFQLAKNAVKKYQGIFGADNFFLEVMDNGLEEQMKLNQHLFDLAAETGTKVVLTSDAHYISLSDRDYHEVMLCIQTGKKITDTDRFSFAAKGIKAHLLTVTDLNKLYKQDKRYEAAAITAMEIPDKIEVFSIRDTDTLPAISKDSNKLLEYQAKTKLVKMFGSLENIPEEYKERINHELQVIKDMKFTDYFLIVADYINWAKQNNITTGFGRGSSAGSLVAYAMGITQVDPIKYNLIFSRFINEGRKDSFPDIDTDFPSSGRDKVITYLQQKYGEDNVTPICNLTLALGKTAVRDAARALGQNYKIGDAIARVIPDAKRGKTFTLKDIKGDKTFEDFIATSSAYQKVIDVAQKLENHIRQVSMHPSGIIISNKPIYNYIPTGFTKEDKEIISQYDMKAVEKIGLIKFDLLSLSSLDTINSALNLIYELSGERVDIDIENCNNSKTYDILCTGNTTGIFQLESSGITELCKRINPQKVEDISDILALYRPGPLDNGLIEIYLKNRELGIDNKEKWEKMDMPDDILALFDKTYGVLVYQEQLMNVVKEMSGASLVEADNFRKAVGKKDHDKMESLKQGFITGCINNNYTQEQAENTFGILAKCAGYLFNLSHSIAYSMITYTTAYLKANYPAEFLAALCNTRYEKADQRSAALKKTLGEANRLSIKTIAPSIHISDYETKIDINGNIVLGLSLIKGLTGYFTKGLVKEREKNGEFYSLANLIRRTTLSSQKTAKGQYISLLKAGALNFNKSRQDMSYIIENLKLDNLYKGKKRILVGQQSLFPEGVIKDLDPILETSWPDDPLKVYQQEMEVLGVALNITHPLNKCDLPNEEFVFAGNLIKKLESTNMTTVVGLLTDIRIIMTHKGEEMCFITLEDHNLKSVNLIVFSSIYKKIGNNLSNWKKENQCISTKVRKNTTRDNGDPIILDAKKLLTIDSIKD